MSLRFTDDEARALGLVKDSRGEWGLAPTRKPVQKPRPAADNRENSSSESSTAGAEPEPQRPIQSKTRRKTSCQSGVEGEFEIDVVAYGPRDRDPDNVTPKLIIDYLVKEGWIPDDNSKNVYQIKKRFVISDEERTEIKIWKRKSLSLSELIVRILQGLRTTKQTNECM